MAILKWTTKEKNAVANWQKSKIAEIMKSNDPELMERALYHPKLTCRIEQAPYHWRKNNFRFWIYLAGRGSGKTHAGTMWVWDRIENSTEVQNIGVVAPDYNSVLKVIIQGPSGLMRNAPPYLKPNFLKSDMTIEIPNNLGKIDGTGKPIPHRITFYTSENPERIRGQNFTAAWLDECASFKSVLSNQYTEEISQVVFATRIGADPQIIVTTTPKNFSWLRKIIDKAEAAPEIWVTSGSSLENAVNLGENYIENIRDMDKNSDRYRQEVLGQIVLSDTAEWVNEDKLTILDYNEQLPDIHRVVLVADCASSEQNIKKNDPSMITAFGIYWNTKIGKEDEYTKKPRGAWSAIVLDVMKGYWGLPELLDLADKSWDRAYGIGDRNRRFPDLFLIENASNGIGLYQLLKKRGINVRLSTPTRVRKNVTLSGKQERFSAVTPIIDEGKLTFVGGYRSLYADWVDPYVKQLCLYPALDPEDPHDEFIDCVTIFLEWCQQVNWVDVDFESRKAWQPYNSDFEAKPQETRSYLTDYNNSEDAWDPWSA